MKPQTNKEIFNRLISDEPSTWHQEAKWREENESWLANSFKIALKILNVLRERSITQKELAENMSVSPQHINKILKGQENLSLETIFKFEKALNISLIDIPSAKYINEYKYEPAIYPQFFENKEFVGFKSFLAFEYDTFGTSIYYETIEEVSEKLAA